MERERPLGIGAAGGTGHEKPLSSEVLQGTAINCPDRTARFAMKKAVEKAECPSLGQDCL